MQATTPISADGAPSGRLSIDLGAVRENWLRLKRRAGGVETGAVVKADAYGLGLARIAPALWEAGARRFYVARTEEGVAARALLPDAEIVVMAPVLPEELGACRAASLVVTLNAPEDLAAWRDEAAAKGGALPAMLHIDTGMTRLGFADSSLGELWHGLSEPERTAIVEVSSHLACADDPDHPANRAQLDRFRRAVGPLPPGLRRSLANSSGMFLGGDFMQTATRPGMALYGLNPTPSRPNPMRDVVTLDVRVLQTRRLAQTETVGYGATAAAPAGARIATIAAGYADGLHRSMATAGAVHIQSYRAPILGRVSMDLIAIDVTDIPEHLVRPGAYVQAIGPRQSADDLARAADTIGYEILTGLGRRHARIYLDGES